MSLRLTWKTVVAAACCISLVGCAPWKPWTKAAPTASAPVANTAGRADNLDRLLNEPPQPKTPARTASKSSMNPFKGDSSKKDAARQSDIDSQLALARLGERRGETDGAKQLYLKLVEKYPDHPMAYHRLGILFARDNNFVESNVYFEQALSLATPTPELLSDYGYCLYLQSRYDDAERVLRHALKQKPSHEASCNNLGLTLGAMGRYAEALETFQRVNSEAEAHANLAYVFTQHGDLQNARHGYLEALSRDNKLREAAIAVVQVDQRLKMQEHDRARRIAQQQAASAAQAQNHPPIDVQHQQAPAMARPPHNHNDVPLAQPQRRAPVEPIREQRSEPRMAERPSVAPPAMRHEAPPMVAMPEAEVAPEREIAPPRGRLARPEPEMEEDSSRETNEPSPEFSNGPARIAEREFEEPAPSDVRPVEPQPAEAETQAVEPRNPRAPVPFVQTPPVSTKPATPPQSTSAEALSQEEIRPTPGPSMMLENPHVSRPAPKTAPLVKTPQREPAPVESISRPPAIATKPRSNPLPPAVVSQEPPVSVEPSATAAVKPSAKPLIVKPQPTQKKETVARDSAAPAQQPKAIAEKPAPVVAPRIAADPADSKVEPKALTPRPAPPSVVALPALPKKQELPAITTKPTLPTVIPPVETNVRETTPPMVEESLAKTQPIRPAVSGTSRIESGSTTDNAQSPDRIVPDRASPFVPRNRAPQVTSTPAPKIQFEQAVDREVPSKAKAPSEAKATPRPILDVEPIATAPATKPAVQTPAPSLSKEVASKTVRLPTTTGLAGLVKASEQKPPAIVKTESAPPSDTAKADATPLKIASQKPEMSKATDSMREAPAKELTALKSTQLASLGASINAGSVPAPVAQKPAESMRPTVVEEVATKSIVEPTRPVATKVVTIERPAQTDSKLPPIVPAEKYSQERSKAETPIRTARLPAVPRNESTGLGGFVTSPNAGDASLPPIISTDDYRQRAPR